MAKPSEWKIEKKRVFNYRQIIFNPLFLPDHLRQISPNELIESILEKAFDLVSTGTNITNIEAVQKWIAFMNEISLLQTLNLVKDFKNAENILPDATKKYIDIYQSQF